MLKYWPLKILILIFIMPAIAAGLVLYYGNPKTFPGTQHGILIQPPQKITDPSIIPHKWHVLYSDPDPDAGQQFAKLQLALGKDQDRIIVAQQAWQTGAMIIDPNGMYIMQYPAPIDMQGLFKDLRKLLKYSHAH